MKKILVMPKSLENLGSVLDKEIEGIILPIKDLAVNSSVYFTISDVKSIINLTSKEICVVINKIMHSEDLELLEDTLIKLNKMSVSKIFFYDLAVMNMCERLKIRKELVVFQDHLNASLYSNNFYQRRGIAYSVITNDITANEINEIGRYNKLILIAYGYLPIFYSKRHLVSNYLEYLNLKKLHNMYYIKNKIERFPILEEGDGTTIYTSKPINLINEIDNINVDYIILNAFNIADDEFLYMLDRYILNKKTDKDEYTGFLNKKSVYRVDDYE